MLTEAETLKTRLVKKRKKLREEENQRAKPWGGNAGSINGLSQEGRQQRKNKSTKAGRALGA